MKLWEIEFKDGTRSILFANNRQSIWKNFGPGVIHKIHQVVIH